MRRVPILAILALAAACTVERAQVVSLALPEDTRDTVGPYLVQLEVRGELGDDELLVCWSAREGGGSFTRTPTRARAGREDLRFAELPGQPIGTTVTYYVVLVAEGNPCPIALPDANLRTFRVLPASTACVVDGDCRAGLEICEDGTCRAFAGTCADGGACPDGYSCDEARTPATCVIPARPCASHDACPVSEECDRARGACVARPACAETLPCPGGRECDLAAGTCALP